MQASMGVEVCMRGEECGASIHGSRGVHEGGGVRCKRPWE